MVTAACVAPAKTTSQLIKQTWDSFISAFHLGEASRAARHFEMRCPDVAFWFHGTNDTFTPLKKLSVARTDYKKICGKHLEKGLTKEAS